MQPRYPTIVLAVRLIGVAAIAALFCSRPARASETVAYCNLPEYAINIYRESAAENGTEPYQMRVFWRDKAIIFVDQPADRTVITEGYVYRNLPPVATDDGLIGEDEATWTVLILNDPSLPCFLFKQGALISRGEVTQRELPAPTAQQPF